MAYYEFFTNWQFKAPQERVWSLIFEPESWPGWWRGVEKVEKLQDGDANHVGAIHRYTWKSKLPYRLIFKMETTRVERFSLLEGRAIGELQGEGRWQLSSEGSGENEITRVRYDWKVKTTRPWMNLTAPIARPLFSWNHNVIMAWGEAGLAQRLQETPIPPSKILPDTLHAAGGHTHGIRTIVS